MRLPLLLSSLLIKILIVESSSSTKHHLPSKCKGPNCTHIHDGKKTSKLSHQLESANQSITKNSFSQNVNKSLQHPKNISQKCKNCTTRSKHVHILPNNKKSKKDITLVKQINEKLSNAVKNNRKTKTVKSLKESHTERTIKHSVLTPKKQLIPPKKTNGCTKNSRLHRCSGKRRKVPVTRNASKRSEQPEISVDENDVVKKISNDIQKVRFLTGRKKSNLSVATSQMKDVIGNHTYNRLNKYIADAEKIKDNVNTLKEDVLSDIPPAISQATVSSLIMTSMNPMHVIRKAFSKLAANALPRTLHMIGTVARILKNISEQQPEDILREAHLMDGQSSRKTNATTFVEHVNYHNDTDTHFRMIRGA